MFVLKYMVLMRLCKTDKHINRAQSHKCVPERIKRDFLIEEKKVFFLFFFFFWLFKTRVSLCSLDCPGMHRDLPVSAS